MSLERKLQLVVEEAGAELVCVKDGCAFFRQDANSDAVALDYRSLTAADIRRGLQDAVHGKTSTPRKLSARTRAKIARLKLGGAAVADEFHLSAALAMQIFEGEK